MTALSRPRIMNLLFAICFISAYFLTFSLASSEHETRADSHQYEIVIYGNTVAAFAAAVQIKRMGREVAIVFPGNTFGGLTTSGLGWTDSKKGSTIGGIARQFYEKIHYHYTKTSSWKQETRSNYLGRKIGAQPGPAIDESNKVQWTFEPKAAEAVLEQWLKDSKIPVFRNEAIDRSKGAVVKSGAHITSFKTLSGKTFTAKIFIDGGYEGDLMAGAGISYHTGREGRDEYSESEAGISIGAESQISKIDPYVVKGQPSSGLIPGVRRVVSDPASVKGKADPIRLQSYNFRMSLTKEASNKIPFSKPSGYKEADYEILFRYVESGYKGPFFTYQLMPNIKTDTNAAGQVSTDLIGGNYDDKANYADYSYAQRQAVYQKHKLWTQGFFWTLANHQRIPQSIRTSVGAWGYAKDEWTSNGNWPYEIYIREGRRMSGVYTMKQSDIQQAKGSSSGIAMGAYTLDVHQVDRVVVQGHIRDDGHVHVPVSGPFTVPYESIVPKANEATNFLNPVTMSASHIAYSAIRMEPTYMCMGQAAGAAAVMAIEQGVKVQDVDREKLKARLRADKQVLSL